MIKRILSPDGVVVASIPNVRHLRNLYNLFFHKDWQYADFGILDKTHIRFFTRKSMVRMFQTLGYELAAVQGVNPSKRWYFRIFDLLTFGFMHDSKYSQYACVARSVSEFKDLKPPVDPFKNNGRKISEVYAAADPSAAPRSNDIKPIALYFPQFHSIPENDRWWGKGFTDWVNVRKARPLFRRHNMPRIPLHENYYDLSQRDVIEWQIELARSYGIYGFCQYHYWFDGIHLLDRPTRIFLTSKAFDFPFCLAWANETWSRRWDGKERHVLQLQTHEPSVEKWEQHFQYLIRAWLDDRAIRIDGKPVFLIYRPHKIEDIRNMFDYWQSRARTYGLDGLYFIVLKQYEYPPPFHEDHFDGTVHFQPFVAMYGKDAKRKDYWPLPKALIKQHMPTALLSAGASLCARYAGPSLWDYEDVWRQIIVDSLSADRATYPGAFVDWDNTPRYRRRATIFRGASPERFEFWFSKLVRLLRMMPDREPYVFINAWNEWAESAYLEPDAQFGYGYLEAVKNSLNHQG
jgi:hypothetical protein